MSVVLDGSTPADSDNPRFGALKIRNLTNALLGLLNLPQGVSNTIGSPIITAIDSGGNPTFPAGALTGGDPSAALGIANKQYVDAKVPFIVATGGPIAFAGTFSDIGSLVNGQQVAVMFPQANTTTAPTFNLNSTGAISIVSATGAAVTDGLIQASGTYFMNYYSATPAWILTGTPVPTVPFPLTANTSLGGTYTFTGVPNGILTGEPVATQQLPGVSAAAGYLTIPALVSGSPVAFLVQWGTVAPATITGTKTATTPVSFPTAFVTAVYAVVVGGIGSSTADVTRFLATGAESGTITTSGFTLQIGNSNSGNETFGAYWIAIGV